MKQKVYIVVIIHSEMDDEVKADAFLNIENHNADVVISVNMLMEGYDHKYLRHFGNTDLTGALMHLLKLLAEFYVRFLKTRLLHLK